MSKSKTNTGIGNDRSRHFIGTNDTGISTYSKDFIEKEGKKGRKEIRRQRNSVWEWEMRSAIWERTTDWFHSREERVVN